MYKLTTDNNNNIRSCLATIANFYMAAQLKIVCAVLFFTHFFIHIVDGFVVFGCLL